MFKIKDINMTGFSNLKKRIISALILIPLVLIVIYVGGFIYNLFVVTVAVLLMFEIVLLLSDIKQFELLKKWMIHIVIYVVLPIASLISLRYLDGGVDIIIYTLSIVWLTDTFAYFGGKNLGGPKLAVSISPNKTITGAISGVVSAIILSIIAYFFTENVGFLTFICIGVLLSIVSQIGDLFESWVKRKLDVKDSGNFIPGHGGICDRVDGLLFVLPVAYLIFGLLNKNIF